MAVVNSLPSQDPVSLGANSMSSCPFSPPAHFPSPAEEEFTIRSSGAQCWMQAKPGPQSYLTCVACYAITELWSVGCASQPERSPGEDAAWWSGKGTLLTGKFGVLDLCRLLRNNRAMIRWMCKSARKISWWGCSLMIWQRYSSHRKVWSVRLRSAVRMDPRLCWRLIKSNIN